MANEVFLDKNLCNELRDAINASPIFIDDERYHPLYNLICAAMDRLDTSVDYLNAHSDYPDTEEDFICFVVFACMVIDGVKKLIENVAKQKSQYVNEKKYFKKYCMDRPIFCSEEECPTDDRFFEHFRALAFAHPYDTNRNKIFKEKFGMQVSPWVSVNRHTSSLSAILLDDDFYKFMMSGRGDVEGDLFVRKTVINLYFNFRRWCYASACNTGYSSKTVDVRQGRENLKRR